MLKNLLSSVGYVGSIPGWETKTHILQSNWVHAPEQEKPHILSKTHYSQNVKKNNKKAMFLKRQ